VGPHAKSEALAEGDSLRDERFADDYLVGTAPPAAFTRACSAAELLALEGDVERAWGEEIDRRAGRVLGGSESGITREQLMALFTVPAAQARAELAKMR